MNVMIVKQVNRKCFSGGAIQNVVGIRLFFVNRKSDRTQFSLDGTIPSLLIPRTESMLFKLTTCP